MNMIKLGAAAAITLALAGCATTVGKDFNQDAVTGFVPHQTTMDQAIAQLGQPQERETESDGSIRLHYQVVNSKSSAASYIPGVSMFAGSTNTTGKSTFLYFDRAGKYLRAESTQSNM